MLSCGISFFAQLFTLMQLVEAAEIIVNAISMILDINLKYKMKISVLLCTNFERQKSERYCDILMGWIIMFGTK